MNGTDALTRCCASAPTFVLLDINMRG